MRFDDLSTLQALSDVSYNEVFLDELESSLFAGMSAINASSLAMVVSVNSLILNEDTLQANFGLRINTAIMHETQASLSQDEKNSQIAKFLQEHLASGAYMTAVVDELHMYPEFAALSRVDISGIAFDRSFEAPPGTTPQYSSQSEDLEYASEYEPFATLIGFVGLAALVAFVGFAFIGAVIRLVA
jgi:hypothetical protein